ncbi:MAG: SMC-Scp complex subunit ScpB [Lachnospiraceae bacterium]|nr:SMC-Scp complex subunit ScpB [Lachnospiraceae bacterium]
MKQVAILEGILFAMGSSVEKTVLAEAMETDVETVEKLADELANEYIEKDCGVRLLTLGDSYQLCTAEACYEALIRIAKKPKPPVLTDVIMETLAIIAYKQPVTKADIERIRGVSSDHAVNRLVEFGLVEEAGRLNAPGRPLLFRTTEEFLRRFRIPSPEKLPEVDPVQMAEIEAAVEEEVGAQEAREAAEKVKVEI